MGSGNHGKSNRTSRSGDFVEIWRLSGPWGAYGGHPAAFRRGAARGRGRSASGSRSEAAGPCSAHVGRRPSKPRGVEGSQWPARPPGARGRQHRGRREAASDAPSRSGSLGRPDASHAAPPGRPETYASRSVQRRPSRLRTSTQWSVNSFRHRAPRGSSFRAFCVA